MTNETLLASELRRVRRRCQIAGADPEDLAQDVRLALLRRPCDGHRLTIRSLVGSALRKATGWSRAYRAVTMPAADVDILRRHPVPPVTPDPWLWDRVARLPTRQRAVLEGLFLEGLQGVEIAARDGVSPRAVNDSQRRGLRNLRAEMTCG